MKMKLESSHKKKSIKMKSNGFQGSKEEIQIQGREDEFEEVEF